MIISREALYNTALFQGYLVPLLAPGAMVGGPIDEQLPGTPTLAQPFNIVSRETIEVQRVPPLLQPVLFMDEAVEEYGDRGAGLVLIKATVYFHIGCTSAPGTAAASILNPLIDTLVQALSPDGMNLGLGDLIDHAQFAGLSVKNLGQNSTDPSARQAAAYIPFEIVFT
jgi:hypothetical protein